MGRQTFGKRIAQIRREKGMTQLEVAEKVGVTDKAVSKWERDLSLPDISVMPKLAGLFGLSVDELMQGKDQEQTYKASHKDKVEQTVRLVLVAVALAMGVAVAVLAGLDKISIQPAMGMLGIGVACLAVTQLPGKEP